MAWEMHHMLSKTVIIGSHPCPSTCLTLPISLYFWLSSILWLLWLRSTAQPDLCESKTMNLGWNQHCNGHLLTPKWLGKTKLRGPSVEANKVDSSLTPINDSMSLHRFTLRDARAEALCSKRPNSGVRGAQPPLFFWIYSIEVIPLNLFHWIYSITIWLGLQYFRFWPVTEPWVQYTAN